MLVKFSLLICFLEIQQPLFAVKASAITHELSIFSDHPVAGNQYGDPVHSICIGNSTNGFRLFAILSPVLYTTWYCQMEL